jgi:peptidoglycan/xylan/chitin deacetylase (PgdA/CDA1 family)
MAFLSLCYHYIRDHDSARQVPRILGNTEEDFREHIEMLLKEYALITLDDVHALYYEQKPLPIPEGKMGMFISFDDGLSDHYHAAKILSDYGIRATFFIPTCVLQDKTPANPQVIHYGLAKYGIGLFLSTYHRVLQEQGLTQDIYHIPYTKGDEPYVVIGAIKKNFKYTLPFQESRNVLLGIWNELLVAREPDIQEQVHLTEGQVREMLALGHAIGVHSRTHLSVGASSLSDADFVTEIIEPRRYLRDTFATNVSTLSYPFGEKQDCLQTGELLKRTGDYKLAFTVETIVNDAHTSPFELGRYMPMSSDDAPKLKGILETIRATTL